MKIILNMNETFIIAKIAAPEASRVPEWLKMEKEMSNVAVTSRPVVKVKEYSSILYSVYITGAGGGFLGYSCHRLFYYQKIRPQMKSN